MATTTEQIQAQLDAARNAQAVYVSRMNPLAGDDAENLRLCELADSAQVLIDRLERTLAVRAEAGAIVR